MLGAFAYTAAGPDPEDVYLNGYEATEGRSRRPRAREDALSRRSNSAIRPVASDGCGPPLVYGTLWENDTRSGFAPMTDPQDTGAFARLGTRLLQEHAAPRVDAAWRHLRAGDGN